MRKIVISIVIIIILALSIMFFIFPKLEFSENENRYLAKLPEFSFKALFEGEYIPKVEEYFTDHFPFRDEFMGMKTTVAKALGQTIINDVYLGIDDYLLEKYDTTIENTKIPYETLNEFYTKIDNVNVSLMLVPTSVEINADKLPEYSINTSQKEVIDYIYENIDFNTINVYDYLKNFSETTELYYRTDHHWNTYGAYAGYIAYMENMNREVLQYKFEKISDEFYGTFYSKTNDYNITPDEIHKIKGGSSFILKDVITNDAQKGLYFEEFLNEKDKFSYFLGQNESLLEITNQEIENDDKILIIKDSYANNLIPFIAEEYKTTYVLDPRYYREEISEFIKQKEIKEVLLVYNMKTVETDLGIITIK